MIESSARFYLDRACLFQLNLIVVLADIQGMKTVIHVNQHKIKSNKKNNKREPVITVKTYKSNVYAREVLITGPCRIIYRPDKPLSCGAHVWLETDHAVEVLA